jgi:hypothetical protein
VKRAQCANPTVCAAMSRALRLCLANVAARSSTRMSGPGSLPATSPALETRPSSRPSSTAQCGPDDCHAVATTTESTADRQDGATGFATERAYHMLTTSLAAMARMSAQETTPGHRFSTAALARTTVSKPSPARDKFSGVVVAGRVDDRRVTTLAWRQDSRVRSIFFG